MFKAGELVLVMETLQLSGMIIGILSINCRGIMAEDWCSLCGGLWLHSNAPSLMKRTGIVLGLGILLIQKTEISLRF